MPTTPPPDEHAARVSSPGPTIDIERVSVSYGSIHAVRDASVHVSPGTVVAIIGPNGSGKSTLLSTISGLVRPSRGRIRLTDRQGRPSRNGVAHVLQATVANEAVPLTVLETVRMGAYGRRGAIGRLTAEDRTAIEDAIDRMQVSDLRHRQLHELSGGQRQRVYVAQGLAQRAAVLLLDEPITGLDMVTQNAITDLIAVERTRGNIVVMTTHDVGTARLADMAILMANEVVASGPPAETLTPANMARAYGAYVHVLDDGTMVLDEPHHHDHRHDDQLRR
ncbi:MAG: metal ABC transporter ATP-binding protein [Nitriliruptoraceae bacterium]